MKIAVYAICLNEEKHVERFCESAKDADCIIIADTGSTDMTVVKAKKAGATVHNVSVIPWRFDVARNAALSLVPSDVDVCISMDLDEVLTEGWREVVESIWKENTTSLSIGFDFDVNRVFYPTRIHNRKGYFWKYACHEYITPDPRTQEVNAHTEHILMKHLPDNTKSRGQYLDLLEVAVKDDVNCHRSSYYLGREYTYRGRWEDAINELVRYLCLPTATWSLERSHANRMIGNAKEHLGQDGLEWFQIACSEDATVRENWHDLAMVCYKKQLWQECYNAAKKALTITKNNSQHTGNADAWGASPHDLAALAAHYLGLKEEALKYGEKAVELEPTNERLITNLKYYKE